MALGHQIKRYRDKAGLTLEQLSDLSGVEVGTISALENRDSQRSKFARAIAGALGLTVEMLEDEAADHQVSPGHPLRSFKPSDITSGALDHIPFPGPQGKPSDATRLPINLEDNPDYPSIRRVRFKLSAGISGFAVEYLDSDDAPIVFQRKWYSSRGFRPERLFAIKVMNGSMEPGLHHGDTVVVNTDQTQPKDGIAFAVNYEGEAVVKRLVRDQGAWWLHSDNPLHPRKLCDENTHILGEIVHKQSEHI